MSEAFPPSDSDSQFGRLVVEQGLARPEQVEECLRALADLASKGVTPLPRLGELLVRKGYLSGHDDQATLRLSTAASPPRSGAPAELPADAAGAARDPANVLGRYIRCGRLGAGGMGEVWRAWDLELRRWVALKFIRGADPAELARFEREAQTAAKLSHPNIAAVYDVGEHAGRPYIAMQLVAGQTLSSFPRDDRRLLAELIRDAALAVHYAHEQGVVHRDLKPQNIMVEGKAGTRPASGTLSPGGPRVYVMDFGLAKQTSVDSSLSVSGSIVGTPAYMPPEQARGRIHEVDARSDVYSLGATFYELLADRPPFSDPNVYDLLRKVVEDEPRPVEALKPGVDPDLATIAARCLEKEPARRYGSARELAEDLQRYLDGEPVRARPASFAYRMRKRLRRNAAVSTIASAAALVALGAAGILMAAAFRRAEERRKEAETRRSALEGAELCRRAVDDVKEAKALLRVRTARREQWEKLFGQARAKADAAIVKYPGFAGSHSTLGEVLHAQGLWKEAAEAFDRALALDPSLAEAWYRRGLCHLELHARAAAARFAIDPTRRAVPGGTEPEPVPGPHKGRALEDLRRYAELKGAGAGGDFEVRYAQAALAFAEGRSAEASEACDRLVGELPTDERPRLLKAQALVALRRQAEARRVLDALISDVMPHLAQAHVVRGVARGMDGDYEGEKADCRKAIELSPLDPAAHFNLAWALDALGEHDGAVESCTRAIELDPGRGSYFHLRAVAEAGRGRRERAVEDATRAIELDPRLARSYVQRASVREALGQSREAQADLDRAIEIDPREETAYLARAGIHHRRREYERAEEDCGRAIECNPRWAEAFRWRAGVRAARENWKGCIEDCTRALELEPGSAETHVRRGVARVRLGEVAPGLEDLSRALELRPKRAEGWAQRAWARAEAEDWKGCLEDATRAIELDAASVQGYAQRARARDRLGDPEGAGRDRAEALRLGSRPPERR